MRYGMMIELDRCVGCQACVSACKERWDSGPGAARDWVMEIEHGRRGSDLGLTFYPGLCNHCDDHPCTDGCPTEATYMNEHGVVVVDPDVCIGCGNCISLCPYGARHTDARKGIVEKCNFCAPYVARAPAQARTAKPAVFREPDEPRPRAPNHTQQPACVATCLAECRHFGDLDDPESVVSTKIRERGALPLETAEVRIGPQVYYAPAEQREVVLESGVVKASAGTTALTRAWGYTRPIARFGVPALAVLTGLGGLLANLIQRRNGAAGVGGEQETSPTDDSRGTLPRHRLGMRFLHWFNVASWVLLLLTGTALMIAPGFALFGVDFPRWLSGLVGGQAALIKLHIVWGLLWAAVIVPLFLTFKRGGIEALREVRITRDDLRWIARKPLTMLGLSKRSLPPQDKYNAGQKLFALSALAGTAVIIGSGLVMTFHLGPPGVIRAAILAHKLAVLLALAGLAVHVTMAAIIAEERPALRSMLSGEVDLGHAEHHSRKWVDELNELKRRQTPTAEGGK
jgi:formate dehydrogenase gamma subunit